MSFVYFTFQISCWAITGDFHMLFIAHGTVDVNDLLCSKDVIALKPLRNAHFTPHSALFTTARNTQAVNTTSFKHSDCFLVSRCEGFIYIYF